MTDTASASLTRDDLEGFCRAQRLAYDCVTHVEQTLAPGVTERQAAARMHEYLRDHGVRCWFHKPFAWFGDRTAFEGFRTGLDFFPSRRKLHPGMAVILDVAPVVDGYAADIGYSFALGTNPLHAQMLADLEEYRGRVLEGVRAGKTLQQIYREVDARLGEQGYRSRHRRYPYGVLAHRVQRLEPSLLDRFTTGRATVGGFGLGALRFFGREVASLRRGVQHHSPLWNDSDACAHRATAGVWAVEPHLGYGGIGVKFEELLVVTETDAYWLDDDLPHVRRWRGSPCRQPGAPSLDARQ